MIGTTQLTCLEVNNSTIVTCKCDDPKQNLKLSAVASKLYVNYSCLKLDVSIISHDKEGDARVAFVVAKILKVTEANTSKVELFSNARKTFIEQFSARNLTLVSPGNDAMITNSCFTCTLVAIILVKSIVSIELH